LVQAHYTVGTPFGIDGGMKDYENALTLEKIELAVSTDESPNRLVGGGVGGP
jgi:hypothetical protein